MARDLFLNGMIYFEAVARRGRISKAAEELEVSASAVSQQIKLLEQRLGVRLFRRDNRQLSLTLEGERLFQTTAAAFSTIRQARQVVSRRRESRQLILRVSPSFGVRWLGYRLANFIQQHPEWDLRVDASPDPSDFEREVVDLDLRYGAGDWSGLYVEQIVPDYVMPMCSPGYLNELRSVSSEPKDMIRAARLIDSIKTLYRWDYWLARNDIAVGENASTLRFDRSSMAIQLAVRGVGVVLESSTLAYEELASGSLVPVSPDLEVIRFPAYWIVSPSRHQSRRIVQLFCTWLGGEAAHHDEAVQHLLRTFGCSVVSLGNISHLAPPGD